jgi:hypothetical protein
VWETAHVVASDVCVAVDGEGFIETCVTVVVVASGVYVAAIDEGPSSCA